MTRITGSQEWYPATVTLGDTTYYYITNLQGDVIGILTAADGYICDYYYDAWGNIVSRSYNNNHLIDDLNPLLYRGYVFDQELGLYYLQSRYYNPQTGRFLNADVYVSTGQSLMGNNMFVYCGNNPIYRRDDTGTYYTSGQIHNFVVQDICKNNPNKTGRDTYISYIEPIQRGKKWYLYGFCDVYDKVTHEVWEVKRLSVASSCSPSAAGMQLGNYVTRGLLKKHPDFTLKFGGTETNIKPNLFTLPDNDGDGLYIIGYFDAGNGLVYYDYYYVPSLEDTVAVACALLYMYLLFYGVGVAAPSPTPVLA